MIEVPNDPVVQKPDSALPSTRPPKHTWQGRSVTLQPRQGLGHVARRVASFVKNSLSSLGQRIGNHVIPSRRAGVQLERFFETCKFRYWSEVNPEALTELEHMTNLLLKVDANKAFSKIENVFGKLVQLTRGLNQYGRSEEERARSQPINDQVVNIYLELASSDTAFSWQNKTLGGFLEQLRGENAAFSHETHERIDTFIHNLATKEQEVFDRFEAAEQIDSKSRLLVLHTGLITREGEGSSFKRYVHPSILLDMDLDTFTELLTDSFIRESLDSDVGDLVHFWAPKDIKENLDDPQNIALYCNRMVNISKLYELSKSVDENTIAFVKYTIFQLDTHILEQLDVSGLFSVFKDIVTEALSFRHSAEPTEVHVKYVLDLMHKAIPDKEGGTAAIRNYLFAIGPQKTREVVKALLANKSYNDKTLDLQRLIDAVNASQYIAYNNNHNIVITAAGVQKLIEGLVEKGKCAPGEIQLPGSVEAVGPALDRFPEQTANSCHLIIGYGSMKYASHLTPIHVKRNADGTYVFIITDSTGVEGFHQESRTTYIDLTKKALQKWCEESGTKGQIYALKIKRQHDATNCPVFTIRDCIEAKRHLDELVHHAQKTAVHVADNYYEFEDPLPWLMKGTQSLKQLESYKEAHPETAQLTETVAKHTHEERNLYAADRFGKYAMLLIMDILSRSLNPPALI